MPLEREDQQHLQAAQGYTALGMYADATAELEQIDAFCRCLPEVLAVRVAIYQASKKWELLQTVAKQLLANDPSNPQWPISLAYATRRAQSLQAAKLILLEAATKHPQEALISYNLGCYECQLGDLHAAKEHLKRAFALRAEYREMALEDSDLEPLWKSLSCG